MKIDLNQIREQIGHAGLKTTHQRIVILCALMELDNHPTVEQIYTHIKGANPSISLATVYKTVEAFVSHGLLSKVSTSEGHMRYDINLRNHGHIYCSNTDEIIDYYDEELNEMIINFFKSKKVNNLMIKNITLQINGDKIDKNKDILIK